MKNNNENISQSTIEILNTLTEGRGCSKDSQHSVGGAFGSNGVSPGLYCSGQLHIVHQLPSNGLVWCFMLFSLH